MIEYKRYMRKIQDQMIELKDTLTIQEKEALKLKIKDQALMDSFLEDNLQEIIRFISSNPTERKKPKKWKTHYDLYVYFSYQLMLDQYNNFFIVDAKFKRLTSDSYRKDIANLVGISLSAPTLLDSFFHA